MNLGTPVLDNASDWLCENCGHVGFSSDSPPSSLTPAELQAAAEAHTLWCDGCGCSK